MTGWIRGWGGFWTWLGPGPRPEHTPDDPPRVPLPPEELPGPFHPEFIEARLSYTIPTTTGPVTYSQPLNRYYFATDETAERVRVLLGALVVIKQPFGGVGGIFSCDTEERHLIFPGGVNINAGILASYWDRNPEEQFPGVALALASSVVNQLLKAA